MTSVSLFASATRFPRASAASVASSPAAPTTALSTMSTSSRCDCVDETLRSDAPSGVRLASVLHDADEARMELRGLLSEQRGVVERRERRDAKAVALTLENAERRRADRPRRPEDGDAARTSRLAHVGAHVSMKPSSTNDTGITKNRLSKRSRIPPCPGMMCELSFTPASRLSSDSARSPICAATLTSAPNARTPAGGTRKPRCAVGCSTYSSIHRGDQHAREQAADRAFDRFSGADRRNELVSSHGATNGIRSDVGRPGHEDRQQEQQAAGRERIRSSAQRECRRCERVVVVPDGVAEAQHAARVRDAERRRPRRRRAAFRRRRATRSRARAARATRARSATVVRADRWDRTAARNRAWTSSGISPAIAMPTSSSGVSPDARAIRKNSHAPSADATASSAASGHPPYSRIAIAIGAAITPKAMRRVSSALTLP